MDRSFLSQPAVIEASRSFVCIRLATYEDQEENAFLKALLSTRSGEVENTVFTILAPDGKTTLVRPGRGTNQVFRDAASMAAAMNRIAARYTPAQASGTPQLPAAANPRLALNIAASDNQPLVLIFAREEMLRQRLADRLRELAWSPPFLGRFVFANAAAASELPFLKEETADAGLLVIEPDRYGQAGSVLARAAGDATPEAMAAALQTALARHQRLDKTFANHVREGHRQGVFWEPALPVTDPMERAARERGRVGFRP